MKTWHTDGRIESDTRYWRVTRWLWRVGPPWLASFAFRLNARSNAWLR